VKKDVDITIEIVHETNVSRQDDGIHNMSKPCRWAEQFKQWLQTDTDLV
jgi:hypothetical protein